MRFARFALFAAIVLAVTGSRPAMAQPAATTPTASPTPEQDVHLSVWRFPADPRRGFLSPYFLFVPEALRKSAPGAPVTLLVMPNNSGFVSDDYLEHEQQALSDIRRWRGLATRLGVELLMPAFPRTEAEWKVYTHALGRAAMLTPKPDLRRTDLQLIAMIDDARRREATRGLALDGRVLMYGFSASAMFTNRFVFLHPDRVKAAAFGSPGGWAIAPVASWQGAELSYPTGVADLQQVSGQPFDLAAVAAVPQFLFMGDADTNDSVTHTDSYEPAARDLVFRLFGATLMARWPATEAIYARYLPKVETKLYPGVAHTVTPQMREDIAAFFARHGD